MIQLPKHRETRTKRLSCVAMTTLVVVVFSICEVSILHADDKSDPAGQKQNPVAKRPKDLTQSDRFEIEDVVDKIEELLDKPDHPPKGVKVEDSESGTTVEVRGPGGKKTIVTKIKKPVENGPTHVIDKADGTSIRVFDEYFEVSGRKSVRVYDRDSGEYLFENPHATSDSAVDQVEPPINQLVSEWIRKFSRGNMSRVEVKHRLRSRGLKLVSVTDPQTNQVTFRARPFTAAEQKTMQLERAKARSARAAWLKKKRSAAHPPPADEHAQG